MAKTDSSGREPVDTDNRFDALPVTRDARRDHFRQIRDELIADDPIETIARCREFVDRSTHRVRRLSEPGDVGTWIPQFSLNAVAAALAHAEKALRKAAAPAEVAGSAS